MATPRLFRVKVYNIDAQGYSYDLFFPAKLSRTINHHGAPINQGKRTKFLEYRYKCIEKIAASQKTAREQYLTWTCMEMAFEALHNYASVDDEPRWFLNLADIPETLRAFFVVAKHGDPVNYNAVWKSLQQMCPARENKRRFVAKIVEELKAQCTRERKYHKR
jgi:hypothetical protein